MDQAKVFKIKKFITLTAALLIGFLMPYISRIPLAFKYGVPWIWKYLVDPEAFKWWNYLHFLSLAPIFIFGLVYIFGNIRWAFYIAALAHFAVTFFCYFDFEEHPHPDDFLGFIIFPYLIGFVSMICGIIALIAEATINQRKMKAQIKKENKSVYV